MVVYDYICFLKASNNQQKLIVNSILSCTREKYEGRDRKLIDYDDHVVILTDQDFNYSKLFSPHLAEILDRGA